jgi:tRNA1(Val) A37 N6-methylase TrmN6
MRTASALLKPEGRGYFIYPASRDGELRTAAAARGLGVRSSRLVLPRPAAPPAFILVRLGFGPGREKVRRPLTLRTASGADSAEARRIYAGRVKAPSRL